MKLKEKHCRYAPNQDISPKHHKHLTSDNDWIQYLNSEGELTNKKGTSGEGELKMERHQANVNSGEKRKSSEDEPYKEERPTEEDSWKKNLLGIHVCIEPK
ncbi:unnamed protein product [Vicia faba]|uniref:Uncharacterized protein n=1 Tax=Vicia faba TaxID=3906 RepID=A0AAV0Z9U8_VICFA|nr:unnamed protein product [Vicia faba]